MSRSPHAGLYVHVPFCRRKCPYCDFYSITSPSLIPAWLEAIHEEIIMYKDRFGGFDSLYLGGGTPSLLDRQQLTTLITELFRHFVFSTHTEITIEANPEDVTSEKIALIRDLGINRISLGVQSFDQEVLHYLKRRHLVGQTEKALELIRSSGPFNLGVDLIYGLEGQSEESWERSLRRALEFQPEHLSCYQLTLEEGTLFAKMRREGRIRPLRAERERVFFLLTSRFLEEQGYIHYEISNFARGEEFCSGHNQKYWRHVNYLGLGPSAHSFQNGVRWWNYRSVSRYCQALRDGQTPVSGSETLSKEQLRLESIYLGFRTRSGIDIRTLRHAPRADHVLSQLRKSRLVKVLKDRVVPTQKGFAVADGLALLF